MKHHWLACAHNLKPRLRVTRRAERLARGQLAELHFWKFRKVFPYQSNSQTFSSFTVISLVDAREWSFPFRSRFEKVLKFCPLAEKRGSLEGVREGGFKRNVSESSEKAASVAKARSVVKQCKPLNTLRVRRKLSVKFRIFQSCRFLYLFSEPFFIQDKGFLPVRFAARKVGSSKKKSWTQLAHNLQNMKVDLHCPDVSVAKTRSVVKFFWPLQVIWEKM
jgi:hypothetical protein